MVRVFKQKSATQIAHVNHPAFVEKRIMEGVNRYFATSVGLVTSTGTHGSNVMAVEWAMHISYDPMLIAIFIHEGSATYRNVMETKEFGVNISSDEQASLVNIAGGYSRVEIDKLSIGLFDTYPARCIKAPMIKGCVINAECIMVAHYKIGDHVAVIGEVIDAKFDKTKSPLIYHKGTYRKIGKKISSNRKVVRVSKEQFEDLQNIGKNAFTLRCVAALVNNSKGETLFVRGNGAWKNCWAVPWFVVDRGSDHAAILEKCLDEMKIGIEVKGIAGIERLLFKRNSKEMRANFVVYNCIVNDSKSLANAKWYKKTPRNTILKILLNNNIIKRNRIG